FYKAEVIHRHAWRFLEHVELATAERVVGVSESSVGGRGVLHHVAAFAATGRATLWAAESTLQLAHVPGRLLDATVALAGRLITGAHAEVAETPPRLQAEVASWGFQVVASIEVPHTAARSPAAVIER